MYRFFLVILFAFTSIVFEFSHASSFTEREQMASEIRQREVDQDVRNQRRIANLKLIRVIKTFASNHQGLLSEAECTNGGPGRAILPEVESYPADIDVRYCEFDLRNGWACRFGLNNENGIYRSCYDGHGNRAL